MKNVLLVFGGKSYEHDISVVTASQIYNKTKSKEIKLVPLYISKDEKFYIYENNKFDIKDFSTTNLLSKNKKFREVVFVSGEDNKLFVKTRFGLKEYLTVYSSIFACHGGRGENGKLVAFLESYKILSSAGSFDSLAVCMNKYLFKLAMLGLKVPVVPGFKIDKNVCEKDKNAYSKQIKHLHFPVIIKVNNGGSSIGVFVVNSKEEFYEKLNEAFEFDNEVLIEKFIPNCREFNVAVIGKGSDNEVSEVDEPLKEHEVLSFADKYQSGGQGKSVKLDKSVKNSMASSSRKFPADIDENLSNKLRNYAKIIFEGLGLSGIVRIDFLYDENNNKVYVCEVNAIPGSLAYYFFKENKLLLDTFVEKLVNIAESKYDDLNLLNEEFVTSILD